MSNSTPLRLRPVTSRQNALVKELRHAFTHGETAEGLCAIEGVRMIEEAIRSRLKLHALFVRESSKTKAQRVIDQLSKHAEALLLPDSVFDSAVLTESPQGIAALVKVRQYELDSALTVTPAIVVVAAGIQDPGNLGTLIRSAEAFGATAAIGIEGTVNFWNPKTVRASAGSIFRLPILKTQAQDLISRLRSLQIRLLALMTPHGEFQAVNVNGTTPHTPKRLQDADLISSCALFIGNEGAGLTRDLLREIDEFVAIPQSRVESLNAGVAASIALYEARRQRSAAQ